MHWKSDTPRKIPVPSISPDLAADMLATHGIGETKIINNNGAQILKYSEVDTTFPQVKVKFLVEFKDTLVSDSNDFFPISVEVGDILDALDCNGTEYIIMVNSFPLVIPSHWVELWIS